MPVKSAFVFPGQGSQHVGMLSELAAIFPLIEETFSEASEILNYDVWQLVQTDPHQQLNQTQYTQPALLTASVALWRLWQAQGGHQPDYMAGHSLGEYSALVCAGAIPFATAVNLVRLRGQYMQSAVPADQGAMAAIIGLADDLIEQSCTVVSDGEVVTPVNYNAPGQVVIAGHTAAVKRSMQACRQAGAKRALLLPISVPSHCSLMHPAAMQLAEQLTELELQMPDITVIQNVTAQVPLNKAELLHNLAAQLHCPVQWTRCVREMINNGVTIMIECGPGQVLSGLAKRINKSVPTIRISTPVQLEAALKSEL
jgi:[acyl-carrier-protein] S-malonyltransferase